MQISTDLYTHELIEAVQWFMRLTMHDIGNRVYDLATTAGDNTLLNCHYGQTFKLELAMATIFIEVARGNLPPPEGDLAEAYSFMAIYYRVHQNLTKKGQRRFEQQLRSCYKQPYGLRPFAFELTVAIHFFRAGCDVTFADVEDVARCDYIVSKNGQEIEVECKSISNDAGRMIDREGLCKVGHVLLPLVDEHVHTPETKLLTITIPERLSSLAPQQIEALAIAANSTLTTLRPPEGGAFEMTVDVRPDLILPPQLKTTEEINRYVHEQTGDLNKHVLIRAERSTGRMVCITLQSRTPDDVIGKILERATKAASQMSRQRPSMIAIQVTDVQPDSLAELFNAPSGIHHIAHQTFEGPPRNPHVNMVAFSALPVANPFDPFTGVSSLSAQVAGLRNPGARYSSSLIDTAGTFDV
jgi:hypothetical protein